MNVEMNVEGMDGWMARDLTTGMGCDAWMDGWMDERKDIPHEDGTDSLLSRTYELCLLCSVLFYPG
jgi:hypothetical protein